MKLSRKGFLIETTAKTVGLIGSLFLSTKLISSAQYNSPRKEHLGKPEQFPIGVHFLPDHQAWLIRNAEGFYCIKAFCTHLGCPPSLKKNKFHCPCHGSEFDLQGHVLKGPANEALIRLSVTLDPITQDIVLNPSKRFHLNKGEWGEKGSFLFIES